MKSLSRICLSLIFSLTFILTSFFIAGAAENTFIEPNKIVYIHPQTFQIDGKDYQMYFVNSKSTNPGNRTIDIAYAVPVVREGSKFVPNVGKTEPSKLYSIEAKNGKVNNTLMGSIANESQRGDLIQSNYFDLPYDISMWILDTYLNINDYSFSSSTILYKSLRVSLQDDNIRKFYKTYNANIDMGAKEFNRNNYFQAYQWLYPLANQDCPQAQYLIAKMYLTDNDQWFDNIKKIKKPEKKKEYVRKEGLKWLRKAAAQNYEPAMDLLWQKLFIIKPINYQEEALEIMINLGERGNLSCQKELGQYYCGISAKLRATSNSIDYKKAIYWWEKAAEQGDLESMYEICIFTSNVIKRDITNESLKKEYTDKKQKWFNILLEKKYPKALSYMGNNLEYGLNGYEKNTDKALEYYKMAYEGGDATAKIYYDRVIENKNKSAQKTTASTNKSSSNSKSSSKTTASTSKKSNTSSNKSTSKQKSSSTSSRPKTSANKSQQSSTQKPKQTPSSIDRQFYNTWSYNLSTNGFWVVGNGMNDRHPTLHITDSQITVSGDWGLYQTSNTFDYIKTNSDGSRVYRLRNADIINVDVVLSKDKHSCNFIHYQLRTENIGSVENFVSDPQLRKKIIADNNGNVRSSDYNLLNQNFYTPNYNPSTHLRYPEYQQYNGSNGNFDERKYNQQNRANCKHCKGTGISPIPQDRAGSRSAYRNEAGHECPHCKKWTTHYHDRCSTCTPY